MKHPVLENWSSCTLRTSFFAFYANYLLNKSNWSSSFLFYETIETFRTWSKRLDLSTVSFGYPLISMVPLQQLDTDRNLTLKQSDYCCHRSLSTIILCLIQFRNHISFPPKKNKGAQNNVECFWLALLCNFIGDFVFEIFWPNETMEIQHQCDKWTTEEWENLPSLPKTLKMCSKCWKTSRW